MKTKIALLTAAFAPLTLTAQVKETASGGAIAAPGGVAPTTVQTPVTASKRLPRVQFQDATLNEIVEYLQAKTQELGLDPSVNPMNLVITPGMGIEEKRVPTLSLRNVSPTEVLTIVTTVLDLHLEPVNGDDGQVVAWLVKGSESHGAAAGEGASIGAVAGAIIGGEAGNRIEKAAGDPGLTTPATLIVGEGGLPVQSGTPATVELASSPAPGGGGSIAVVPQKQVRVFGIASLIASRETDRDKAQDIRKRKFNDLIETLTAMAVDQTGNPAEIKFYEAMDIIVVKSADPAVMTLVGEAIEAMKKNGAQNGEVAQAQARVQDAAMRAELEALKGQLKIAEAEREMTRRTYADQLEVLKAAQKAQNADPKSR